MRGIVPDVELVVVQEKSPLVDGPSLEITGCCPTIAVVKTVTETVPKGDCAAATPNYAF